MSTTAMRLVCNRYIGIYGWVSNAYFMKRKTRPKPSPRAHQTTTSDDRAHDESRSAEDLPPPFES
jgi:hypothetical protein